MILGQTLLAFIVALAVLVFVHEMGHYLAARACGVKVLRFSIGFGPALATWRTGPDRTEWCIAAIPLGGYVRMLDERDTSGTIAPAELPRAFTRQSLKARAFIVAAGPAANFLLAIALYAGLAVSGVKEPAAVVDAPPAGSIAAQAGFRAGDRVVAVDGEPIDTWNDLRLSMLDGLLERRALQVDVRRGQGTERLVLPATGLPEGELDKDPLQAAGLQIAASRIEVAQVMDGSAAQRAGLQAGDQVTGVDGEAVSRADALIARIREAAGRPLVLQVLRGDARLDVPVTPEAQPAGAGDAAGRPSGRIGAALQQRVEMVEVATGPVEAVAWGLRQTWEMSSFSLRMLGRMLTGDLSWRNLSGPVSIADYAGQSARIGWEAYLGFLALVSVSLGVLNLLPVPVLDGGHLVYYAIEAVLRRPPSARFVELTQRAGIALVMTMMVLALFNDLSRLLGS